MDFMLEKKLAMLNVLNATQKKRRGVGASCSVLLRYLHPVKLIAGRYPNKDKHDAFSGIIITRREVIRVNIREQLCVFMQHEHFEDHGLHCVQRWVRVNTEGYDAHMLEDI